MMNVHDYIPISVLTDSYKASHFVQYPDASKMVAVRVSSLLDQLLFRYDDMMLMRVPTLCAVWRI